jgi:hypothetical protein
MQYDSNIDFRLNKYEGYTSISMISKPRESPVNVFANISQPGRLDYHRFREYPGWGSNSDIYFCLWHLANFPTFAPMVKFRTRGDLSYISLSQSSQPTLYSDLEPKLKWAHPAVVIFEWLQNNGTSTLCWVSVIVLLMFQAPALNFKSIPALGQSLQARVQNLWRMIIIY